MPAFVSFTSITKENDRVVTQKGKSLTLKFRLEEVLLANTVILVRYYAQLNVISVTFKQLALFYCDKKQSFINTDRIIIELHISQIATVMDQFIKNHNNQEFWLIDNSLAHEE